MLGDSSGKTNSFKDCLQKTMPSVVEERSLNYALIIAVDCQLEKNLDPQEDRI